MLKTARILLILAALGIESSKAQDVLELRLTLPTGAGSAMLVGARSIKSGLTTHLSKFATVDKITLSQDPLKDLYDSKTDIAVVPTASLSSRGAEDFAIFDLPFLFSGPNNTTEAQLQGAAGAAILSSLHKQGLVGLGFWNEGMSQLFGATVRDFDDLKGKKVCILGSPTTNYLADAKSGVAEWAAESRRISSQNAGHVLVALGATPVSFETPVDPPRNTTSWQSTCETSDVVEATPTSVDAIYVSSMTSYLGPTPKSISSRGFRPLVYTVVMRERVWESLTARVQQGLIEEVARSGEEVSDDATSQERIALKSLFGKGFEIAVAKDDIKDSTLAVKAWRGAAGYANANLLDLVLSETGQTQQPAPAPAPPPAPMPPPASVPEKSPVPSPEKHGEINRSKDLSVFPKLLFATDRKDDVERDPDPRFRFGNTPADAPGKLTYGVVSINADPDRRLAGSVGKTEIRSIDTLTKEEFRQKVLDDLNEESNRSVIIYVHGYWNTFREAALSAKILSDDLNLGSTVIFYSWPSNAQLQLYSSDEDRVVAGRNNFIEFVKMISDIAGADNVTVFAHSMGARLTTFALDYMSANLAKLLPPIHEVVLAAPDIDVSTFSNELPAYRVLVQKKATIYASNSDMALKCSEVFHNGRRVGQGGENVFVSPDVDTIDASEVERKPGFLDWLSKPCARGHSYYIDNLSVQEDIHELIASGVDPPRRHRLVKKIGGDYWVFKGVN
jgi:esterase/lipase superfamily enzyme/TRAP-type C4-dicarboxylate transport system substrate-binding protein